MFTPRQTTLLVSRSRGFKTAIVRSLIGPEGREGEAVHLPDQSFDRLERPGAIGEVTTFRKGGGRGRGTDCRLRSNGSLEESAETCVQAGQRGRKVHCEDRTESVVQAEDQTLGIRNLPTNLPHPPPSRYGGRQRADGLECGD